MNFTISQFINFFEEESKTVQNYKSDLWHDIKSIMNFAYHSEDKFYKSGRVITDKPVSMRYIWLIRVNGTHLIPEESTQLIQFVRNAMGVQKEFKITITANSDYLSGVPFAKVERLK